MSFECGFVLDENFDAAKMDMVLEFVKHDVKNALNKNSILCSNLIHSKDIKCVEVNPTGSDKAGDI